MSFNIFFIITCQKYTDERLKKIHDTLVGIKVIKLNAWDEVFLKKIQVARKNELKYLNKDATFWTLMGECFHRIIYRNNNLYPHSRQPFLPTLPQCSSPS